MSAFLLLNVVCAFSDDNLKDGAHHLLIKSCSHLRRIESTPSDIAETTAPEPQTPKHKYRVIAMRRLTSSELLEHLVPAFLFGGLLLTYAYFYYDEWRRLMYGSDFYRDSEWLRMSHIGI